jgi:WD40 repeat protein
VSCVLLSFRVELNLFLAVIRNKPLCLSYLFVHIFYSVFCDVADLGSDGLVKLWTIKTNECIATYDKHDGKVCYLLCTS